MTKPVVTRFAPSPTGFLHIGGARTALFNWLYAKRHGGKMVLRIEDTDRVRSTQAAVDAILDGLSWLGLDWDGEPVSQFSRLERHREIAEELLKTGRAYKCYASQEELEEMREKAREKNLPPIYDGRWRDRNPKESPEGVSPVIRLKTPQDGFTYVKDKVQGDVKFANKDIDDFIILRSDGTPTYMLAVVVDDHDMDVTHVIRGDDHLTNAARQTALFEAMEWDVPVFAHIPLIHGQDGAKLSKRHGAFGAEAYRAMGYLPHALKNYLVRLGWAKGDEEIISEEDMISWFGFEGIGKGASRFDMAKLDAINSHYIKKSDEKALLNALERILPEIKRDDNLADKLADKLDDTVRSQFIKAMPVLKERAKTLIDLMEKASFIYDERPLKLTDKAAALLTKEARHNLESLKEALSTIEDWTPENLDETVRDFVEKNELKLGKVAQPLRAALTGTTAAPGIFEILDVLGKQESLLRIDDQA